jgi:hypothetical protein
VPELKSSTGAQPVVALPRGPSSGTWAMIQRLLALQRSSSGGGHASLREEAALARRYASDLKGWNEVIDRESWQALERLALDLLGERGHWMM